MRHACCAKIRTWIHRTVGGDQLIACLPWIITHGCGQPFSGIERERRDRDARDARRSGEDKWEVYVNGGRTPTGLDCLEWITKAVSLGAGEILLTSMDADGTKDGYDIALTRAVSEAVNVPVIASGGAGKLEHFYDVLTEGKADAVLAASVFHYGEFTVRQVKEYLKSRGVEVRF